MSLMVSVVMAMRVMPILQQLLTGAESLASVDGATILAERHTTVYTVAFIQRHIHLFSAVVKAFWL